MDGLCGRCHPNVWRSMIGEPPPHENLGCLIVWYGDVSLCGRGMSHCAVLLRYGAVREGKANIRLR